ncbi:MAG TPA: dehypoxanthine futalosine cyclase [Aquifex sp.]|uniref:Cyclic dehypoxanthine futalosine synthase n=1 Tax=Aquifex aeolicus TaxID=63363 RepID=A0A9D0YR77_AQUAO|nr:dehypoxanthine futalosine cyclase [Aquifex sp.]HIP98720.1 dehypoxanthine futalosine cyclase [Aquifex aeolicus]
MLLQDSLTKITQKVIEGKRLTPEEGFILLKSADLNLLGYMANVVKKRFHPNPIVTFVVDRNVNYTNICITGCKFCAFYIPYRERKKGYILSLEEVLKKVQELVEWGGTTLLMQGGINPDLGLDYFVKLFREIKKRFPQVQIHSLSAPEIVFLAKRENITVEEVLKTLKEAGLDSVPGGGAELLTDRVRNLISPNKCSVDEWFEVHETAHKLGMKTTATMMFGHYERDEDIVSHLLRVRDLQDKTGGFTAFIPWTFVPGNTQMDKVKKAPPTRYLRVLAFSRVFLDNFKNVQSSHVTQTLEVGVIGLHFGANDLGSVMIEESVITSTGYRVKIPKVEEMVKAIKKAGFIPAQRDTYYRIMKVFG